MNETIQIHESPQCNEAMHTQTEGGVKPSSNYLKNNKTIICEICKKEVETKSLNRKYCSECYKLLQKINIRKWNIKNRTKEYYKKEYRNRKEKILLYNKTHSNYESNVKVICKSCGYLESHYGNGLCKRCYNRENEWKNLKKLGLPFEKRYLIDKCVICNKNISMYHSNAKYCVHCSKIFNNGRLNNLGTRRFSPYMRRTYDYEFEKGTPDFNKELIAIENEMKCIGLK